MDLKHTCIKVDDNVVWGCVPKNEQDLSKLSLQGAVTINNLVADGFNKSNYFLTEDKLANNKTYE